MINIKIRWVRIVYKKIYFFLFCPILSQPIKNLITTHPQFENLCIVCNTMVNKNIKVKIRNRARHNSRTQTQHLEINSKIIDRFCSELFNIFIVTSVTITIIIVRIPNKNNKNTAFK